MEPSRNGNGTGSGGVASISRLSGIGALPQQPRAELSLPSWPWFPADKARRFINVVIALLALVIVAPLMLIIALLVKISSPGPVFYRQPRVGLDRRNGNQLNGNWRRKVDYGGRLFSIYKFRTMYVNDDQSAQTWASPDDPRVTVLGRVLRRYRLDELPQLINVLKGEMNIVGPRPEQPRIFAELREQIDHYPTRQRVLPGITGWAQVNQHYDTSIEDVRNKLDFDLEYIEKCSPAEDLKILLRTVPVVLFKKGAW